MSFSFKALFWIPFFFLAVMSCSKSEDPIEPETHWDYEHPHWQEQGYSDCAGLIQSPVDIRTDSTVRANLPNLEFSYKPFPMKLVDNGHTIQVSNNGANSLTYNGKMYEFKQFHYHSRSEHLINGASTEMELHLVHQNPQSGSLLVVGYMINEGSANPLSESVLNGWPAQKNVEVTTAPTIDLNTLLPEDRRYYTYIGSLTTPPCSQGVTFFILKQGLELSAGQLARFKAHYSHNARPVQPLNARLVYEDTE
jgi:carbonic anhydrase